MRINMFNIGPITRGQYVAAVISGLLLTGSLPDAGIHLLAWVALLPLLAAIRDQSPGDAMRLGFITGFIHFITLMYWLAATMQTYGGLPMFAALLLLVALTLFLALYPALFAWIVIAAGRRPGYLMLLVPASWVTVEYLRGYLFSGLPWEFLGYSQHRLLPLIQVADLTGVYGLSFLIGLVNAALFLLHLALTGKNWQGTRLDVKTAAAWLGCALAVVGLAGGYGLHRIRQIDTNYAQATALKTAVVQGNIEQALKWDTAYQIQTIQKYVALSQQLKSADPALVVWPETATPFYFLHDKVLSQMVLDGIAGTRAAYLIGSPSFNTTPAGTELYNSAFLIDRNSQPLGRYDKVHLVPYGEYVPFKKWLPFIDKLVHAVGDFKPGRIGNTLTWQDRKIGVQICYEIIFPHLARRMVKNGADFLVNITNDAWFGRSGAPYQHFSMAVFRAVENRRALIRSANTGISGFIDPVGRVLVQTGLFEDATATQTIRLLQGQSLYTRWGDVFAQACLLLTIVGTIVCRIKHRRQ